MWRWFIVNDGFVFVNFSKTFEKVKNIKFLFELFWGLFIKLHKFLTWSVALEKSCNHEADLGKRTHFRNQLLCNFFLCFLVFVFVKFFKSADYETLLRVTLQKYNHENRYDLKKSTNVSKQVCDRVCTSLDLHLL